MSRDVIFPYPDNEMGKDVFLHSLHVLVNTTIYRKFDTNTEVLVQL